MAKVIGDIVSIQNPKSGSGGGGNAEPFVITFNTDYQGDKTYSEVVEAIENNVDIIGVLPNSNNEFKALRFFDTAYSDYGVYLTGVSTSGGKRYVWHFACSSQDNKWSMWVRKLLEESDISNDIGQDIEAGNMNKIPSVASLKSYVDETSKPFVIDFGDNKGVGDKTYAEIAEAMQQDKSIIGKFVLDYFVFTRITHGIDYVCLTSDREKWYCWEDTTMQPETNGWEYREIEQLGDIETALERIIEIQNTLIGGDGE